MVDLTNTDVERVRCSSAVVRVRRYRGRSIGRTTVTAVSSSSIVTAGVFRVAQLQRLRSRLEWMRSNTRRFSSYDLVVEEPTELLGETANGRLGALAGVDPVEVDSARRGSRSANGVDHVETVEQVGQLGLAVGGKEQVVEGPEAPSLVGFSDATAVVRTGRRADHPWSRPTWRSVPAAGGRGHGSSPRPDGSRRAARGRCGRTAGSGLVG